MDRIYAQTACNTPKRKENLKSHHMTPLILKIKVLKMNEGLTGLERHEGE